MFTFSRHCLLRKPRNALLLLTDVQFACFTSPGWARLSTRMSSHFRVIEHTINCSHSREYPAGSANGIVGGNELKLAVKQYIPLDNPEPKSGDVTIVATHANGVPKVSLHPGKFPGQLKICKRNYMNRCGTTCIISRNKLVSASVAYGWQTSQHKGNRG